MKKLLIILITIPLIFNSCKKEDDSPNSGSNNTGINNTSGSILGTWEINTRESSLEYGYIDPILGTEIVTDSSTEIYTNNDTTIEFYVFRNDNTHSWYVYYLETRENEEDYNYVKDGNVISIYDSLLLVSLQLTTLTDNNLNFYWDKTFLDEGDDTTFFEKSHRVIQSVKSVLPSITNVNISKKKNQPVKIFNSFLNRRNR